MLYLIFAAQLICMRVVVQRVKDASVQVDNLVVGQISHGILVYLGIHETDDASIIPKLVQKLISLRIFNDEQGLMNKSVQDVGGHILIISQFTLYAETKKGNRPSYIKAARPEQAIPLYEQFTEMCRKNFNGEVQTGIFGADMKVSYTNDGPVTIIIDTQQWE